jgi:polysaccharide deacetylase family protein (PEP-CTERM system associated)
MDPRGISNAMTVDLEDWYQGLEIPSSRWDCYEDRVAPATRRLLGLFDDAGVRATFFVLGDIADRHPELVAEVVGAGHEIATHGQSHAFVYDQTPEAFRTEIERCVGVLEDITGQRVAGHRAPFFSITRDSLWALDVLADLGILYDSSVFPVSNYRYGIPDAPRWPYHVESNGGSIMEFPISTARIWGRNMPVAGGAYFRIYPYALSRRAFKAINRAGRPAVFYLHPWEVDPDHPRLELPRRISATHYFNLRATERRLRRLLRDFRFGPMKEVLGVG